MARLTNVAFLSKWGSLFADNSIRDISEEDLRDFRQDIVDSFLSFEDNFIDDDTMATASATTVPSSESVKAYVDSVAGSAGWISSTVSISSAEILALNGTPKLLVSSPGAGFGVVVSHVIFRHDGPTTAYATNVTMRVYLGSVSTPIITDVADFLNVGSDRVQVSPTIAYGNTTISSNHIYITVQTGNPTTGNGAIKVEIIYKIVPVT